ncbi:GIY-YIG nuclease family protein [Ekhidna sp.]|uniref:GIY-YIG nuclease family protein n=1 Tax=Ekhidna sp. TaxID=2608089 RepID=UPI0032996F90
MKNQSADEIFIYVLRLENGKYYVGQTNDLYRRFRNHQSKSSGAEWTRLHRPTEILRRFRTGLNDPELALKYENERTLRSIEEFGWQHVRGGDFINVEEEHHHLQLICESNLGNKICPIEVGSGIDIAKFESCVFTLLLEENKYFIGTTKNLNLAILSELNGRGADWTRIFKPKRLIRVVSVNNDQEFECLHFEELKRAFLKYPCVDVRGGRFNLIHSESHWRMVELINWN